MKYKQITSTDDLETLNSKLSNETTLKQFFTFGVDDESNISIQSTSSNIITGLLEFLHVSQYFEIRLEQKNPTGTIIHLTISDTPLIFTETHKQETIISTKRNYQIGMVAAIAILVMLTPTGFILMFSDNITDISEKTTVLSETESLNQLGINAIENQNYNDAQYYFIKSLQQDSGNLNSVLNAREVYPFASSNNLFQQTTSSITIYSDGVMIYPDKEHGFVIPKENNSINLNYPGDIPIVYPTNGEYPVVIFDKTDLTKVPLVMSKEDPNLTQTLQNVKDKIVIQPIYRDSLDTIQYAETANPDGSLVVYPYGFGDVPVLVFPDEQSYPAVAKKNVEPTQNYLVPGTVSNIHSADLIPISYTEVNLSEISNVPRDISVRVLGVSHNVQVDFPLGLDNRPVINYPTTVSTPTVSTPTSTTGNSVDSYGYAGSIGNYGSKVYAGTDSITSENRFSYFGAPKSGYGVSPGYGSGSVYGYGTFTPDNSFGNPGYYGDPGSISMFANAGSLSTLAGMFPDSGGYGSYGGATAAPESPVGSIALVASFLGVLGVIGLRTKVKRML